MTLANRRSPFSRISSLLPAKPIVTSQPLETIASHLDRPASGPRHRFLRQLGVLSPFNFKAVHTFSTGFCSDVGMIGGGVQVANGQRAGSSANS